MKTHLVRFFKTHYVICKKKYFIKSHKIINKKIEHIDKTNKLILQIRLKKQKLMA
jgi:hypothetical protein